MLRVLDPIAALARRGYATDGEARVDVHDPHLGDVGLSIRVRNGRAEVERASFGSAPFCLHTRGLAALYTGFAHPSALRAAGLLTGGATQAAGFARLFASHEPWLCDWF